MSEKELSSRQHENKAANSELAKEADQANERIHKQHEQLEARSPEKNRDTGEKDARREALEQASAVEAAKEKQVNNKEASVEKRTRGKTSKHKKDESYAEIMNDTRSQMPPANRAFSKVIHNRAVEVTSEAVGSTLARPNAVLTGSVSAFIVVLAVYLVARHYGYPLSGSETLISFAAGWLLGILFDFFRVMITGKR